MEVHEALAWAWAEVLKAKLPDHLHEAAFKEAIALLSDAKPVTSIRDGGRPKPPKVTKPLGGTETEITGVGLLKKMAEETGIPASELEDVMYFKEQTPFVKGPARKLGTSRSAQSRRVALLLAAAHHYALDEPEVSSEVVREECRRLKCFDTGNFGTSISSVPGTVTNGQGRKKNVRMKSDDNALTLLKSAVNEIRGVKDAE